MTNYDYNSFYPIKSELWYYSKTYESDLMEYSTQSNDVISDKCQYAIRMCYKSCKMCNQTIIPPNDNEHGCTECNDTHAPIITHPTNCLYKYINNDYYYYDTRDNFFHACPISCQTCFLNFTTRVPKCIQCNNKKEYYNIENIAYECPQKIEFLIANANYYLNLSGKLPILSKCHDTCATCSIGGNINQHNCDTCIINFSFYNDRRNGNCYDATINNIGYYKNKEENKYYNCSKSCYTCHKGEDTNGHNCDKCKDKYFFIPSDSNSMSCYSCYETCALCSKGGNHKMHNCDTCITDYSFFEGKEGDIHNCLINRNNNDGYYYNRDNNTYLQCYPTCFSCIGKGDEFNHNCIQCPTGQVFNPVNVTNCMPNCPRFWQMNQYKKYVCANECTGDLSYLIPQYKQCVSNCPSMFSFNYLHVCYKKCPINTTPFEKKCFPILSNKNVVNKVIKDLGYVEDNIDFLYHFHNSVTVDNTTLSIYNTSNSDSKENSSLPKINLGDCENILKKEYEIPLDESLLIYIRATKTDDPISKIDYLIFDMTGNMLNLSYCSEAPIDIIVPLNFDNTNIETAKEFKDKGIDVYNPRDPFFSDMCIPYATKNGLDIPRSDRTNMYLQDSSLMCPKGCKYKGINYNNEGAVNCSCANFKAQAKEAFDALKASILSSLLNGNWDVFRCHKLVFNISSLPKNIGSWFSFCIFLILSINSIYFCITRLKPLEEYIKILCISTLPANPVKLKQITIVKNKKHKQEKLFNRMALDIMIIQKKNRTRIMQYNKKSNDNESNCFNIGNDINNNNNSKHLNYKCKKTINSIIITKPQSGIKLKKKMITINQSIPSQPLSFKKETSKLQLKEHKKFDYNYSVNDFNDMIFEDLYHKDYRTPIQHYWYYLQLLHPILNTFCIKNKRILRSNKISSFFLAFVIDFALSAFFYTDQYISNNNKNNGNSEFWYNIPISLYSSIFSFIMSKGLSMLHTSEDALYNIEKMTNKERRFTSSKFIKCYKIKLIIYYILHLIIVGLFWYYITSFCSMYKNSQWEWIKSGLISSAIGFGMPFIISVFYTINIQLCLEFNLRKCYKVFLVIIGIIS